MRQNSSPGSNSGNAADGTANAAGAGGPVGPAGAAFGAVPVPGHQSWAAADAADADAVSGETDQDETLDTFHGTTLGTWHDTKLTSANSLRQSSTTPQQARSFIMIQTVPLKSIECH